MKMMTKEKLGKRLRATTSKGSPSASYNAGAELKIEQVCVASYDRDRWIGVGPVGVL